MDLYITQGATFIKSFVNMHVNGNPECNHYSAKQSPTYHRKGTFAGFVMYLTHQGFYLSHFTWLEEHYYPKRSLPTYSWATERSWIIFLHKMILVHLTRVVHSQYWYFIWEWRFHSITAAMGFPFRDKITGGYPIIMK